MKRAFLFEKQFKLPPDLPHQPFRHRFDQTRVFGQRNEQVRSNPLAPGLPPADQRFGANASTGLQVDNRLVIDLEFIFLQTTLEFSLQGQTPAEYPQQQYEKQD